MNNNNILPGSSIIYQIVWINQHATDEISFTPPLLVIFKDIPTTESIEPFFLAIVQIR
jgi:hypothetical protein